MPRVASGFNSGGFNTRIFVEQHTDHVFIPAFILGTSHGAQGAGDPGWICAFKSGFDQRGDFQSRGESKNSRQRLRKSGLSSLADDGDQGIFYFAFYIP